MPAAIPCSPRVPPALLSPLRYMALLLVLLVGLAGLAAGCAAPNGRSGADLTPGQDTLPQAATARLDGVLLAWRDLPAPPGEETARPLLLLTGFAMTGEGWDRQFLRGLNAGRRVVVMENRGMGAAAGLPPGAPVDLPTMARDAARLLEHLGIAKADVLGWSMGGGVALELALARPERVAALALYAPPLSGAAVKPVLDRMFAMSPQELKAALFPQDWAAAHPEVWAELPRPAPLPEGMAVRQYAALCAWPGVAERLPDLRVPALFLAGEADWVCPAEDVRVQAQAAHGARLELVPQGGHWMMHQEPRTLARLVDDFLNAQP
ncbi:Pimeloyl-ACP methyl ester carboxylesterase [Humidesulfovibrio mexicanus]|uniref:Pimeloyl-ACP methyl ester carboxylesterase n=1 Tax=Humidesulfovibrio mexicanus TaxID=147047 RepID=A0A239A2P6_9BACT|nr:alpha/beta hydrolase [Humidesulfovibrio mexicanus]SNR89388.1 Pimeloyl-ACP methyl ester carboxylesterase [Humidesulfovibrio mexicanus]